jgi:hypothetical protein
MKVLLDYGAKLDIPDNAGKTVIERIAMFLEANHAERRQRRKSEADRQAWKKEREEGIAMLEFLLKNVGIRGISRKARRNAQSMLNFGAGAR